MSDEKKEDIRVTLGPIAIRWAAKEAGGEKITRDHLELAFERKGRENPAAELAQIRDVLAAVAADLVHLRHIIVALHAPTDGEMRAELELANNAAFVHLSKKAEAAKIPTRKARLLLERIQEKQAMLEAVPEQEREPEEER